MRITELSGEDVDLLRKEPVEERRRAYLAGLLEGRTERYIENCRAELRVVCVEGKALPFTVSRGEGFLNDPLDALLSRTAEVLSQSMTNRVLFLATSAVVSVVHRLWTALFHERVLVLNNWLSHDYAWFDLEPGELSAVLAHLHERYPGYVVFLGSTGEARLEHAALRTVYYTPEYFFEPAEKVKRVLRNNLKYLERTDYEFRYLGPGERPAVYERLRELYDHLYVGKYEHSMLYSPAWFRLNVESGLGSVFVFEKNGRIDMFGMVYEQDDLLLGGVMGYDMTLDYRALRFVPLVTSVYFLESIRLGRRLNAGASNDDFKLKRGCSVGNVLAVRASGAGLGPARRRLFDALFSLLGAVGWRLNARHLEPA